MAGASILAMLLGGEVFKVSPKRCTHTRLFWFILGLDLSFHQRCPFCTLNSLADPDRLSSM